MRALHRFTPPTLFRHLPPRAALTPPAIVTRVRDWGTASQQTARRNAMVAATDCADRRAVRREVEEFLLTAYAPTPRPRVAHG